MYIKNNMLFSMALLLIVYNAHVLKAMQPQTNPLDEVKNKLILALAAYHEQTPGSPVHTNDLSTFCISETHTYPPNQIKLQKIAETIGGDVSKEYNAYIQLLIQHQIDLDDSPNRYSKDPNYMCCPNTKKCLNKTYTSCGCLCTAMSSCCSSMFTNCFAHLSTTLRNCFRTLSCSDYETVDNTR